MVSTPKTPLISVALCSYNGVKYIEAQIQSILNQSYKNIELIICDDGSTDGTWESIYQLSQTEKRIKAYQNKNTLGFNKNFEKAFSLCNGELIAISDQDDIWIAQKLERLLANIGENLVIGSNSLLINEDGKHLDRLMLTRNLPSKMGYKSFLLENPLTGHTALLKRDLLKLTIPFPEEGYYDWWIGFVAAYHEKFCFLNEPLTYYRIHSDSAIQKEKINCNETKKQQRRKLIKTQLKLFLDNKELSASTKKFISILQEVLTIEQNNVIQWNLFKILRHDFTELFPGRKMNNFLNRYFFLFKYCSKFKP